MTVLTPYKKTAGLIYLIYAKETPRHWPGTLTRNKNVYLKPKGKPRSQTSLFPASSSSPKQRRYSSRPAAAPHAPRGQVSCCPAPHLSPHLPWPSPHCAWQGMHHPPGLSGNTLKCPQMAPVPQDPWPG